MKKYYRLEAWVVIKKIVAITGSFNPVTVAHYKILSDAVEKCGADEGYDSSNDDCNPYFISIFDAEDDLCALLGVEPGDPICAHPDDYVVEEITEEDTENDVPAGVFRYCFIYEGERVCDSLANFDEYYDTYDEAREAAESYIEKYEIETDVYPCDRLFPIEVEKVEIVEFDYKEED